VTASVRNSWDLRACARQARQQQQAIETLQPLIGWFLFFQASCRWAKQRATCGSCLSSFPAPPRRRSAFNPWTGDPSKAFVLQGKKGSVGLRTLNERMKQLEPLVTAAHTASLKDIPPVLQLDGIWVTIQQSHETIKPDTRKN